MKNEELRINFIKFSRNNQEIIAGFIALLALLIAMGILFSNETVGVLDYGEYTQTLYDMGLSYTQETMQEEDSLHFVKIIEKYQIDDIKILQLLQLKPSQSLIYPVSMISVICKLLHIYFSTRYLAFLLMMITVVCIYSITKSAYCFLKEKAAVVGIACCFVFLCGNYIIYFNSLYRNGIFFVSFLSFFSILLHIVATDGKAHSKIMIFLMIVSLLLLNAKETTIVLLPIVAIADIWAMMKCRPKKEKQFLYYLGFSLLLFFVVRSNLLYTMQNEALFSNTQLYHSFFTGVLEGSSDKEALLEELGINPSLAEDVGKNAYLSAENYVVAPSGKAAEKEIFSHLSYPTLCKFYIKHPDLYLNVLKKTAMNLKEIDTYKFLYTNRRTDEGTEWVERFIWWQWVRSIIVPESLIGYFVVMLVSFIVLNSLLFMYRKDRKKRSLIILGYFFLCCVLIQFMTIYAWQGFAEERSLTYYFILPYDVFQIFLFGLLVKGVGKVSERLPAILKGEIKEEALEVGILGERILGNRILEERLIEGRLTEKRLIENQHGEEIYTTKSNDSELGQEELFVKNPVFIVLHQLIHKIKEIFVNRVLIFPNRAAFFFLIVSAIILIGVLFYPTRIGAYNNGDFGRMMSAMNIKYTAKDWEHSDELSLTKVVEKYDWEENYDYSKILPTHVELTQIWFSLPLKILDNIWGVQFSTVYVTIMYSVLITISIFFIMQVLFRRFGPKGFWLATALLFILLDLVNLGWLNSLFGEGIAFVSFLMVIACLFKIADMEKGTCIWSFLFLIFSEMLFIGAKAQFTITTPLLLLVTFILFLYHRPHKVWRKLLYYTFLLTGCVWICVSAVKIYQNNESISSPDAIYHAVFYGLLMLVDDPRETLIELGLDPAMAVDTGKHAFLDKSEYYCPPRTEKAEEMLYSKITTFDVLGYYLKHPILLWKCMDMTAKAASLDMPNYTLIVGQKTTLDHDIVNRFHIWGTIRSYLVFNRFWEMLLLYGMELILILKFWVNKDKSLKDKLLMGMLLAISGIGIIQFPLTVIGNGFADNTKQLYIFRLTYDLTVIMGIYLLLPSVIKILDKLGYCFANKISLYKEFMQKFGNKNKKGGYSNEA